MADILSAAEETIRLGKEATPGRWYHHAPSVSVTDEHGAHIALRGRSTFDMGGASLDPVNMPLIAHLGTYGVSIAEALVKAEAWKAEALAVEATWDVQAIAKAMGLPLGADVRAAILPFVLEAQKRIDGLEKALANIAAHTVAMPVDGVFRDVPTHAAEIARAALS